MTIWQKFPRNHPVARAGFSLIEVVVAVGIVAIALLAILGVYGGLVGNAGENFDRRSMQVAVDSLRGYFERRGFDESFQLIRDGKELVYATYWADAQGNAAPGEDRTRTISQWMEPGGVTTAMQQAHEGRWVRARLAVSPSNPGGTSLPASAADYSRATLMTLAAFDVVPHPNAALPERPRLQITLSILR